MNDDIHIPVRSDEDIVSAREQGRELAQKLGFQGRDLTFIPTAISEMARNILQYAKSGEVQISATQMDGRRGILIIARDKGPGIPDISLAMRDGYSTGKGLGIGLPGTRRLMDEFEISSTVGKGTVVTMIKWL